MKFAIHQNRMALQWNTPKGLYAKMVLKKGNVFNGPSNKHIKILKVCTSGILKVSARWEPTGRRDEVLHIGPSAFLMYLSQLPGYLVDDDEEYRDMTPISRLGILLPVLLTLVKAKLKFRALRALAMDRKYAPGGLGHKRAREEFNSYI
tara:strand:+ start:622 stop:1068 length:447 start_codon:yes stop_codon:yes gene_type:complete